MNIRVIRLAVITLLALSAFWGFSNGPREVLSGANALQKGVGVLQILYGLAGVLALLALWFRPARAVPLTVVWAIALTATVVLATIAWPAALKGALMAIAVTAGLGWLVIWSMRAIAPYTDDRAGN